MNISEVVEKALAFFGGDILATNVWLDKYALKNKDEVIQEDVEGMFRRLATELTRIEKGYLKDSSLNFSRTYNYLYDMILILGGSNLYGIGNPYSLTSLGNCFFVSNDSDSYGGIMSIDQETAQLMKRRGGVGTDLSHIRPSGSKVTNSAGSSTGSVNFAHRYSYTTREVAQDGRRGALMISHHINHPDIEKFITVKDDLDKVTGANISVKVTDDFMNAVIEDEPHILRFPIDKDISSISKDDKIVQARELWDKIIHQAWKNAEPGVLFWDKITSYSPADAYKDFGFGTKGTNPCGEIPLSPYDSCRLLAINLYKLVTRPFKDNSTISIGDIRMVAYEAQIMMDNIIDLELEKINNIIEKVISDPEAEEIKAIELQVWKKIRENLIKGRRTGLGILGLGDMLAALGLRYDSEEAIDLSGQVMREITIGSYMASIDLAKERGAFPLWNYEVERDNEFLQTIIPELPMEYQQRYKKYGRRNIANVTIAPTGTIAILSGVSSGMEPVFQLNYKRRVKVHTKEDATFTDDLGDHWKEYQVIHKPFNDYLLANDIKYPFDMKEVVSQSPYYQSTAHEVSPFQKLKMQAALQKWIDHSISNTYNLPKKTTEEEVSNLYKTAWELGCKGITVYREGSRNSILSSGEDIVNFEYHDAPKRPKDLDADLHTVTRKGETFVITIGKLNDKPYELFAFRTNEQFKSKHGIIRKIRRRRFDFINDGTVIDNIQDKAELITKMVAVFISMMLRHGAKPQFIVKTLNKFDFEISSLTSAIIRVLKQYITNGTDTRENCPECGQPLKYEGGCESCISCTYSKCS